MRRTVLVGCFCLMAAIGRADDTAVRDYDRFDIRFGGGWVFGANTTVSLIGQRGLGTVIDYNKTLDGETTNAFYRFDGAWRMAKKHSLMYSWYDVNRTGLRTIDRQIDFGDQTYAIGSTVESELDIQVHRLLYRYSLVRNEAINFDFGGGIYYGKIDMTLTANNFAGPATGVESSHISLKAPMPTVGVNVECKLSPRWGTFFSADWFYFAYNEWEGAQSDLMIGVTYKVSKNITLGAAYDRFAINLKGPVGTNHATFKVDNDWNSLFSFLSYHW